MSLLSEQELETVAEKYSRFKEAPWFSLEPLDIIIGGQGGIGIVTGKQIGRAHV